MWFLGEYVRNDDAVDYQPECYRSTDRQSDLQAEDQTDTLIPKTEDQTDAPEHGNRVGFQVPET